MFTKNLTYALSLLTAVLLAAFSGVARAASYVTFLESVSSPDTTGREQVYRLYFACDKTTYDGGYMDNELTAEAIMALLQELDSDRIESVTVTSYASPEGVYEHNLMLSRLRGKCFESLAKTRFPLMNGHIRLIDGGEAWEPFRQQVFEDMQLDESVRVRILSLLDDDSVRGDTKKWRLQNRFGADTWRYILKNHFRYLRCVEIRIAYLDSARSIHTEATVPGAIQPDTTDTASQGIAGQDGQDTTSQIIGGQDTVTSEVKTSTTTVYVFTDDDLLLTEAINADDQDLLVEIDEMSSVASYPRIPVTDAIENQPAVEQETPQDNEIADATEPETEDQTETAEETETESETETGSEMREAVNAWEQTPLFALSTNTLFDLAITPNFAIEVPFGHNWSGYIDYTFPWWLTRANDRAWQIIKLDLGARYWLSRHNESDPWDILTGHFVGIDLGAGYYDIEPHHKGYQGEFQMASVEYGYTWRLGKYWRLQAYAGAGWMATHYRYYEANANDTRLIYKYPGRYTWFGPTKVGVSIEVIIPNDFWLKKKNDR